MQDLSTIQLIAVWTLPVLFAIIVHEVAHGWVANLLGDKTALMLGRLTLNPIKHMDLMGTVIIPIVLLITTHFIFGWAKPVPVDPRNFKNPKQGMALVAAAGPLSNLAMAIAWGLVLKLGILLGPKLGYSAFALIYMGQAGIFINLILGVLNLIPIPPLDGSRVLSSFLPNKAYALYNRIEPYGFFILLGLLMLGGFEKIINPPVLFLNNWIIASLGIR